MLVGHGLGAWFAWSMAALHPEVTAAVAVLSAPHPRAFHRAAWRHPRQRRANTYLRAMQAPFAPEREVAAAGQVTRRLHEWSGPDRSWLTPEVVARYEQAAAVPFVATAAAEYYRWLYRCPVTLDGARYLHALRTPVAVPVLQVHGAADPAMLPALSDDSARHVAGPLDRVTLPGVGHFPAEEAPAAVTEALLAWLRRHQPADRV